MTYLNAISESCPQYEYFSMERGTVNLASSWVSQRLRILYPAGLDPRMLVLFGCQRYRYIRGSWYQLPLDYNAGLREILPIPLNRAMADRLRQRVARTLVSRLNQHVDQHICQLARQIARETLAPAMLAELDALLLDRSQYVSVIFDNLFAGWEKFDLDKQSHLSVALGMKLVILSCTGEFRTPGETLRLVKTEAGHVGKNGSRGSGVFFYEHTDGVHFSPVNEPDLLCLMGLSQPPGSPDTYISPLVSVLSRLREDYIKVLRQEKRFEVTAPPSDQIRHLHKWAPVQIIFGQHDSPRLRLDGHLIRANDVEGERSLGALLQELATARIPVQLLAGTLLLHRNNLGSHARGVNQPDFTMTSLKQRRVFSRSYVSGLTQAKYSNVVNGLSDGV